jgi:hypothetical protein
MNNFAIDEKEDDDMLKGDKSAKTNANSVVILK